MLNRALFLDRDGIFNEIVFRNGSMHSPKSWDEIKHYPGLESLSEFKNRGFKLILITNQPDVERGIITKEFVEEVNSYYMKKYNLDAAYYCPFASNSHPDKKPNPGLFLRAAKDFALELSESFHLGDTDRDLNAALRCGCRPILWERPYNKDLPAELKITKLEELHHILLG